MQAHVAERNPISDGGNLTILQMWEQAGLLPPNKVQQAVVNQLLHTSTVLPVVIPPILL